MTRIFVAMGIGLLVVLAALTAGCEKKGPAQQAGEAIDKTVDKAADKVEKAGDDIKDATKADKQ